MAQITPWVQAMGNIGFGGAPTLPHVGAANLSLGNDVSRDFTLIVVATGSPPAGYTMELRGGFDGNFYLTLATLTNGDLLAVQAVTVNTHWVNEVQAVLTAYTNTNSQTPACLVSAFMSAGQT
jgi:hypothetical protein